MNIKFTITKGGKSFTTTETNINSVTVTLYDTDSKPDPRMDASCVKPSPFKYSVGDSMRIGLNTGVVIADRMFVEGKVVYTVLEIGSAVPKMVQEHELLPPEIKNITS